MPHQPVRRLASARPKPSGLASVWEISYRTALRAGSKQEILRAEWIAPGVFQESKPVPFQPLVGNSNLFESGDPKNGRSWIALGMSETARSTGRDNHRQGASLVIGGLARGRVLLPKIYQG